MASSPSRNERLKVLPMGRADGAHERLDIIRMRPSSASSELGYLVEADPLGRTGMLIIRTGQATTAVGLAADLQRTLAKCTELPANGQQPSP